MSYQLPWEQFPEGETVELPYKPTEGLIERVTPVTAVTAAGGQLPPGSVSVLEEAFQKALSDALPWLRQQSLDYAKEAWAATAEGKSVDHLHPSVTAVTSRGHTLVVADAKSRSLRTLGQGLVIDLVFALIALAGTLTNFDPLDKASWAMLGVLVVKTVVQTGLAYLMRIKVTPTAKTKEGDKVKLLPLPVPVPKKEGDLVP